MAKWSPTKKAAAVGGIGAAAVVAYLLWPRPVVAPLDAMDVSSNTVVNADQSITVSIVMVAVGGVPPYSFSIDWHDGQVETNGFGSFTKTFPQFTALPSSALVTVKSSDGQSVAING